MGTLLDGFIAQELNDSVRAISKVVTEERKCSKSILSREFEFNCFDVSLDFEKGIVTLHDVLAIGESSFVDIPLRDFISACSLDVSHQ